MSGSRYTWILVQLAAIAAGILGGIRLFDIITR